MGDDFDLPPDDEEAEIDEDEWPPFRKVLSSFLSQGFHKYYLYATRNH